jgi:TRAP transporter TAXI family solute receptor
MSARPRAKKNVGPAVPLTAAIAGVVAVVLITTGILSWRSANDDSDTTFVVATGAESGIYHLVGEALARGLVEHGIVDRIEVRTTQGSVENMDLLENGEVDLALAQSDTPVGDEARLVATLFDEVLHILVARDLENEIRNAVDLEGRTVSLGSEESGTRQLATRVLRHLDITVGEDLVLPQNEAIAALEQGRLEAMFLLTAVPSPVVDELADRDLIRFASFGDPQQVGNPADALALVFPRVHSTIIPQSTYGTLPNGPTQTVAVTAELMCSRSIDPRIVEEITWAIFNARSDQRMMSDSSAAIVGRVRERYVAGGRSAPYHPGAITYYERFNPPFVVEYAEALSFGLTLLVGVWSCTIAVRQWMKRRMKNRIDAYYIEVLENPLNVTTATDSELHERRDQLIKVRERAFADLVAERLEADESFSIFQNQVAGELASIAVTLSHRGSD